MGRFSLWVLLGLTMFALSLQDVQVRADVGPTESECRPYIEKAIHELKGEPTEPSESGGDSQEQEASAEDTGGEVASGEQAAEGESAEQDTDEGDNDDTAEDAVVETVEDTVEEADDDTEEQTDEEKESEKPEEADGDDDDDDDDEQKTEEDDGKSEETKDDTDDETDDNKSEEETAEKVDEDAKSEEDDQGDQDDTTASEEKEDDAKSGEEGEEGTEEAEGQDDDDDDEETTKEEKDEAEAASADEESGETQDDQPAESVEDKDDDDNTAEDKDDDEDEDEKDEEGKSEEEQATEEAAASEEETETAEDDQQDNDEDEEKSKEQEADNDDDDDEDNKTEEEKDDEDDKGDEDEEEEVKSRGRRSVADEDDDDEPSKEKEDTSDDKESAEDVESEGAKDDEDEGDSKEGDTKEDDDDEEKDDGDDKDEKDEDDEEGDEEEDAKSEEESQPEDDLLLEVEIPENLRERKHIDELLHLDDEFEEKEQAIDRVAEIILRDLKRIYENAVKPLETLYKYRDLSNRHFSDPEIFSKPLILFMGPWSGGKSTIINYLTENEYTMHSLRSGAEPSPAYFNIVMYGNETEILDGTQLAADWTFSGLQKFGQGLEDRLRGLKLPNKLLEKVNIVEIPGILEVRKQVSRLFPFNDACQWFIDRADIIFLVYDPAKLDVGPETEAILDQLKGREYQTRIILNKADTVKPEELLRVQSALIWNISPLMSSAQPPVMYTTSLWSHPYETSSPIRLLQAQERAFLRDIRTAVDKRIENKIASARRFAVRVRNHAKMVDCYLTTYYNHKTLFGNKKRISDQIIENPQNYHIYEGLSTLTNISRYDLPDPEVYRDFFRLNPLYEFKKLSETCTYFRGCPINKLDVAIAYDLPELVGKYKKMAESALATIDSDEKSKS